MLHSQRILHWQWMTGEHSEGGGTGLCQLLLNSCFPCYMTPSSWTENVLILQVVLLQVDAFLSKLFALYLSFNAGYISLTNWVLLFTVLLKESC